MNGYPRDVSMTEAIETAVSKEKIEKTAKELFEVLLKNNLTEAESVASLIMTLCMRTAYASRDLEDLIQKIDKAQNLFGHYARANLSSAMSVILAKNADLERMN